MTSLNIADPDDTNDVDWDLNMFSSGDSSPIHRPNRPLTRSPTTNPHPTPTHSGKPTFFDLPREIRDMIYANFPYLANIPLTQDPRAVAQPSIGRASRRLRAECLDVFYARHNFWLDLRGWKDSAYPPHWTPGQIFTRWIEAIGDANAARLRSLSFVSHNFSCNLRLSVERPIRVRLRFTPRPLEFTVLANGVSALYSFRVAAARAEQGLRKWVADLETAARERDLGVGDFRELCQAVEAVQPFLCYHMALGWRGAVLHADDLRVDQWPNTAVHRASCDDCGYLRFQPGRG